MIEAGIRTFELDENVVTGIDFMETAEFELVDNCDDQINSKNGLIDLDDLDEDGFIAQGLEELSKANEIEFANKAGKIMAEHGTNLYALFKLYQYVLLSENIELINKLNSNIYKLAPNYPLAKLILAFNSVYFNLPDIRFAGILYSNKIQINFPEYHDFGADELQVYWLTKTLKNIADDDLEDSVFYYKLAVETCVENVFLWVTQEKIIQYYNEKMELYN